MVYIDTTASLESFRKFLINSTCLSFIPESYLRDPEVFPEKEGEAGSIYIEAGDKVTLKKIRDITFINARDVLGIIYISKSGNSRLKWRQIRGKIGKVTGEASANSLVNLITAGVITKDYAKKLINIKSKDEGIKLEGVEPFADEGKV
ncbi:MAG: hypothetical protein QW372_05605 [Nitrososphaerales archaeon]